jgi:predicted acetyltransferase
VSGDPYTLRTLETPDDFTYVWRVLSDAFGQDLSDDEAERERLVFEPDRAHVIDHDEDGPVGTAAAFTREVTVPGAVIPGGHVTQVGVRQVHRRRGLLTRLMLHQLRDIRERGEPVALLWASEGRIYQRFGYGFAGQRHSMTIDTRETRLIRPAVPGAGRLREAPPEQFRKELQQVYERVRADFPGRSSRDENWWSWRLSDPSSSRGGFSRTHALVYETGSGADGYALWRRNGAWEDDGPKNELRVGELVAATPEAYLALWDYLLAVDLTRSVRYHFAAADEPLRYLVNEPRALGAKVGDSLWVRLVDVPAALSARRYQAPVDVVLDVTDALLPENAGRWRLTGDPGSASCVATTDAPDLTCDVTDLGAIYLGGAPLATLAAGGRVREERPGALESAATAFGWYRAPSPLDVF